jgi:type IV pilus secretin PilQ/predicted competence protein
MKRMVVVVAPSIPRLLHLNMRGEIKFMIARRLVTSILLLTVVANTWVFALPKTESRQEGPSFHLVSLKTETVGSLTRISIESNSPPLYTVFKPADHLIVVDFPGGDGSQLTPWYSVKSAAVDTIAIRKSQATAKAAKFFGTSLEIKVQGQISDRSILQGNTLIIEISSEKVAAQETKKAVAKPGVYVEPAPIAGSAIVEPTPVKTSQPVVTTAKPVKESAEKTEPVADDATLTKPATMIRNVRSEAGEGFARIIIEADGNAPFKDFVLSNPYRIVVDITGVRNQASSKPLSVGAASVDKVRLGQPSANVVRVVVDAKSQAPYQVAREGASLVITIGDQLAARNERARAKAEAEKVPSESKAAEPTLETRTNSAEIKVAGQRIDNEATKPVQPVTAPQANKPTTPANTAPQVSQPNVAVNTIAQAQKTGLGNNDSQTAKQSLAVNNSQPAKNPLADKSAQVVQPSVVDTNSKTGKPSVPESLNAQAKRNTAENRPRTSAQPSGAKTVKELVGQPVSTGNTVADVRPALPSVAMQQTPARPQSPLALCEPDYRGGLISFDLRAGVDLRDMLRFVSQQYGVNFIVDQSVRQVPVDIRVNDLPWNYVLNSVMRANRLGWVCDQGGIVRIASLDAIAQEVSLELARKKAESDKIPLVTKILHLKYARAGGDMGVGGGSSTRGSVGGGGGGVGAQGGVLAIAQKRLSPRGSIEMDPRSNSIIVTDLPEYLTAIEDIVAKLDKPEAQVEIEARIVIASRNFLRDIGVELAAGASTSGGKAAFFGNAPVQFVPGSGVSRSTGSGSGSGSGTGGTGSGTGGTGNSTGNLIGPTPTGAFSAAAGTVLSLTTGIWGTTVISAALSLQETKGQIRTIASPRVTVTDNQPAEIVNGVQIPVQTVSNNTITTTFVTAALRLQITPQIIEENSEVLIRVIAENNTVNFNLANQFNNGTPGINTQSAESTVRVPDGGTTVMGGINIDNEGHTVVRTPGVSRIPLVGELFKKRTTRRDFDEILFFITPRIIRNDNQVKPKALEPLDGRVTPSTPPTKTNSPKQ